MKKKSTPIQDTENQAGVAAKPQQKKAMKVVNIVINVVLVIAIVLAAICTYVSFVNTSGNGVPSILGLRLMSIQTPSMKPTINDGDLIISTAVDVNDLRPGDIITYWTVIQGERVLNTHRIDTIYDGEGFLIFETKGDANPSVDPLTVHQKEIVGKYQFRIGGLGKVFDYLKEPEGFFLVVVIPVFIFFIFHLVQFFRALFEYQNVKNRIKFEKERDAADAEKENDEKRAAERAAMEEELRAKLRAEIMADMQKQTVPDTPQVTAEPVVKVDEEPAAEEVAADETAPKDAE